MPAICPFDLNNKKYKAIYSGSVDSISESHIDKIGSVGMHQVNHGIHKWAPD